jgi:hypothetical protein
MAPTREPEPVPDLPPNLPERVQEWPVAWREFFLTQRLALEREAGLSPQESTKQALAIARQDFREVLMPRTAIAARVAAETGADLQALSLRLGKDLSLFGSEERVELELKLISLQEDWSGWNKADKDLLGLYLIRYSLEQEQQHSIRKPQCWQAYLQRTDRYGTLPVSPRFPNSWMEREAYEYDLDLVDLSTRLGVNLCNLTTLEEVVALGNWLLHGNAHDLVTEQERRGLDQVILAYKRSFEPKKPKEPEKPKKPKKRTGRPKTW